jgi:hypothetical protein
MPDLNKKEEKNIFAEIFLDKEAKLSKKSWHYQLLKFILGESMIPKYNFCPYFWLTIFSMFVFPILAPFRLVYLCFKWLYFRLGADFEKYIIEPLNQRYAERAEKCPDNIYIGYLKCLDIIWNTIYKDRLNVDERDRLTEDEYSYYYGRFDKFENIFLKWREATPDWEEKIKLYKEQREKDLEKRYTYYKDLAEKIKQQKVLDEKRLSDLHQRQAKIKNIMIKSAKYLVVLLLIPIGYILYYSGVFVYWFIYWIGTVLISVNWYKLLYDILVISYSIAIIVISLLIIKAIQYYLDYTPTKCDNYKEPKYITIIQTICNGIAWPFIKICNIFSIVFKCFIEGFRFFFIFFKNWKSDNCPEIVWIDEEKE